MSLPYALGLFTVRDLYQQDFDACLAQTAALGYTGVECFGEMKLPAQTVAQCCKQYGLSLVGWHLLMDFFTEASYGKTVEYLHAVDCQRAIVPFYPPETFQSRDAILAFADAMNALDKRLRPEGIRLGYHNHAFEFVPLADGTLPWTLLMDNTDIITQLDNGNALESKTEGIDVAALVAQWPGRAITIHAKPYSHKTEFDTMIGEDDIDWPAFLQAAEKTGGAQWAIVEYEADTLGQFEGAEACLRALEKLG